MATTKTYTGTLNVLNCAACSMTFGISTSFENRRREDHDTFYCPAGHSNWYSGLNEKEQLRESLDRERSRRTHVEDQLAAAEASRRAYKGHLTRIRNRIADGVCPWCQRSFANVRAHVTSQHPGHADAMTEALA